MNLTRLFAFEVVPQRKAPVKSIPKGGSFAATNEIRDSLRALLGTSKLEGQSLVDFRTGSNLAANQRSHVVRDLSVSLVFDNNSVAKAAASKLAERLANAMDDRSPPTLLMITAFIDGIQGRIIMWAFPQEEAFQFSATGGKARIKVLSDIFSRSSRLRKAALFEGQNRSTDFWSGRVIDLQATGSSGKAADYWLSSFLDCRFALSGDAGTRLLVTYLRDTYDACKSDDDREQLYNSMVAVRTSPKNKWSFQTFADHYLHDGAKRSFLQIVPSEQRTLTFEFKRKEFEDKLNFRVFRLKENVYVSAPFETIGSSVQISNDGHRTLTCKGEVVEERVRARYA
jgi:hypothetical protein